MWSSTPRPATRRAFRPALEALEDRVALNGEGISHNPHDWPMFNHNPQGTRHNTAESRLRPSNVDDLEVLWEHPTDGAIAGTPAVVDNVVYAADSAGSVYAVDRDGDMRWKTTLEVPAIVGLKIAASPLVTNRTVIIGDNAGFIHGLDVNTGVPRWRISPNPHPFAAIFGNGTMVGRYVAYGTSSFELLVPALDPRYTNFTFRGSVVLIDPSDGRVVWQTFTITDAEAAAGASGATVWGAPAYDKASDTIFVGTSNNYSQPTTGTSDALIALDADDGAIKWVSQKTGGDHWNFSFLPEDPEDPPDFDIGDSPQVYRLHGRTVVGVGQKSGFFHVVDAATGAEVHAPQQFLAGDHLGGFHIDSAFADGVNYAPGNDWHDPFSGGQPTGGRLFAIKGNGSRALWDFDVGAPVISGVSVANGVVYLQAIDGNFYALDARDGDVLAQLFTGGQSSGPAVSRGQVYLGTGDLLTTAVVNPFHVPGPASLVALGLDDGLRAHRSEGTGQFLSATEFLSTGTAARLGDFTERGTIQLTPTANPAVVLARVTATITTSDGAELRLSALGVLNPLTGELRGTVLYAGGTGRFEDALGVGILTAQLFPDGTYQFTVEGFLTY
jgi:polyvinyl alcohol dehydrogenase (cytochrome)